MDSRWKSTIASLDHRIERYSAKYRKKTTLVGRFLIGIARYGPALFFLEMLWLLFASSAHREARIHALLALFISVVAAISTKLVVDPLAKQISRERPFVKYQYKPLLPKDSSDPSFPSNHAGGALALTTVLVAEFPNVGFLTVTLALLVIVSRLYTGLHYLTDLISGGIIGFAVAMFYLWLMR